MENKETSQRDILITVTLLIVIFCLGEALAIYYAEYYNDRDIPCFVGVPGAVIGLQLLIAIFAPSKSPYRQTFAILSAISIPLFIVWSVGFLYVYALGAAYH